MRSFGYTFTHFLFFILAVVFLFIACGSLIWGWVWITSQTFGIEIASWTWAVLGLPLVALTAAVSVLTSTFFYAAAAGVRQVYKLRKARGRL